MPMNADQYRAAIRKLGMTQRGAAKFLSIGERTSRRFAADGNVDRPIAMLLTIMLQYKITPDEALSLIREKRAIQRFDDTRYLEEE